MLLSKFLYSAADMGFRSGQLLFLEETWAQGSWFWDTMDLFTSEESVCKVGVSPQLFKTKIPLEKGPPRHVSPCLTPLLRLFTVAWAFCRLRQGCVSTRHQGCHITPCGLQKQGWRGARGWRHISMTITSSDTFTYRLVYLNISSTRAKISVC